MALVEAALNTETCIENKDIEEVDDKFNSVEHEFQKFEEFIHNFNWEKLKEK